MTSAIVKAPQDGYNGKTLGVRFTDGVAQVNETTVPKTLGRTPDEVLKQMKQDHPEYVIEETNERTAFTVPQMPWKKDPEDQPADDADKAQPKKK